MPAPTLPTKRLSLTPFTESDVTDVFAYASDPEVARYVSWDAHKTIDDSKAFVHFAMETRATLSGGTFWVWAIRLPSNQVIGSIQFLEVGPHEGQIDFALSRKHWQQGYMSEAVAKVIEWGFLNHQAMNRIRALALPANLASQRTQEKVGMLFEGTLRDYLILKGKLQDLELRAITRQDHSRIAIPVSS